MKLAIVGAGAMGSIYAGLMADAGNEVWAIDTWAEHIDAIKEAEMEQTEHTESEKDSLFF